MKIYVLVASPGTGKTAKIVDRIKKLSNSDGLMAISFTNATVKQLRKDIKRNTSIELPEDRCTTLHSLALRLASPEKQYILMEDELRIIQRDAKCIEENYEKLCEKLNCKDFNQVIRMGINYIKTNPTLVRERLGKIELMLVDEFQDFNMEEQEFIKALALLTEETWIVGDDDQAIYDFKKANPQGIIDMHNDPTNFKIEHEGKCHRCPKVVVEHATNLISNNNPHRLTKTWTPSGKDGFLKIAQFLTKEQEKEGILGCLRDIRKKDPQSSILVLYPNDIVLGDFPARLKGKDIEYREFVKDIRAFIKARHLLNIFRLKDVWLNLRLLIKLDVSCTKQYYKNFTVNDIDPKSLEEVKEILKNRKKLSSIINPIIDCISKYNNETIAELLNKSGFEKVKEIVGETKELNLILGKIEKYLEDQMEINEEGINIMTIHKSKGLEADYVFLMGVTDGVLPHIRSGTSIEGQRRLMYVALTRCKKGLFLSTASRWEVEEKLVHKVQKDKFKYDYRRRVYFGNASPFLSEMKCEVKSSFE